MCFDNIEAIIKKLSEVLKYDFKTNIGKVVEIKETRNLLLHNNLVVNDFYLNKTKNIKRSERKGEQLLLDKAYVKESVGYIIDGPVKPPKDYFGSSEKFFYEVWKSQRTASGVSRFAMVYLDSRNINKLSLLIEVFGELRFPYW